MKIRKKNMLLTLAITMSLGISTLNVSAAECAANETEHTNYYLFLDALSGTWINQQIEADTDNNSYVHRTGASMANNFVGKTITAHGTVTITNGNRSTTSNGTNTITWTAADFWKYYSDAVQNQNATTHTYDKDATTSFMLHDGWDAYASNDSNWTTPNERQGDQLYAARNTALANYLVSHYNNMGSSSLVTTGSAMPNTRIFEQSSFETSTDSQIYFRIMRTYTADVMSGLSDDTLDDTATGTAARVYGPTAYYIKWCQTTSEPPATSKTLKYNANGGLSSSVPANQTFTGSTTTINATKTPTRDGYTFKGWSNNSGANNSVNYNPGDTYTATGTATTYTVYAVWEKVQNGNDPTPTTYTITYDANGGVNAPKQDGPTNVGTCTTISNTKPTREGSTFLGWSRNQKAAQADKNFAPGEGSYCGDNGNITLYAVWSNPSNPTTGVTTRVMAFAMVALAAGAGLYVAKKKDLFRQL